MKLNNIFDEMKIAFVGPRDILGIFVRDTAKALSDILLQTPGVCGCPCASCLRSRASREAFWRPCGSVSSQRAFPFSKSTVQ